MSKNKQASKAAAKPVMNTGIRDTTKPVGFNIPSPMVLLIVAVLIVYIPSFSLGYTELDDTIFIREFSAYNEDLGNLLLSFTRGLFDPLKDPYYRPLFSDAMIFNYHMSGLEPGGYHAVNILLHLGAVLLLFKLTSKLNIKPLQGFLLSLVFAVHPVLSQAVAWIPGRNDTMLAVFVLSFLIWTIAYADSKKPRHLALSALFLLLAFFTKETAVFAAPAAFMLLVLYTGRKWNAPELKIQYVVWIACFGIWFAARAAATIQSSGIATTGALNDLMHRLPVIVQYLGKVFLPFNLSVFPTQEDTVIWYGLAAILVLTAALARYKGAKWGPQAAALGIFLLFLMPALLVPAELNRQTFEHRLYLPIIGLLLLLPHTILLNNQLAPKRLVMIWGTVCLVFAVINNRHQQNFDNPGVFWTSAATSSPNSAYANMMMAARLDKSETARSEAMFRKAYRLNPKEKYLNFYIAEMLQRKDSVLASEPYLMAEKKISDYVQCDFYLARVYMEKGEKQLAINSLVRYLGRDKTNSMAHNNLLLLYIETQQMVKARAHVADMRLMGLSVPGALAAQLGL